MEGARDVHDTALPLGVAAVSFCNRAVRTSLRQEQHRVTVRCSGAPLILELVGDAESHLKVGIWMEPLWEKPSRFTASAFVRVGVPGPRTGRRVWRRSAPTQCSKTRQHLVDSSPSS